MTVFGVDTLPNVTEVKKNSYYIWTWSCKLTDTSDSNIYWLLQNDKFSYWTSTRWISPLFVEKVGLHHHIPGGESPKYLLSVCFLYYHHLTVCWAICV